MCRNSDRPKMERIVLPGTSSVDTVTISVTFQMSALSSVIPIRLCWACLRPFYVRDCMRDTRNWDNITITSPMVLDAVRSPSTYIRPEMLQVSHPHQYRCAPRESRSVVRSATSREMPSPGGMRATAGQRSLFIRGAAPEHRGCLSYDFRQARSRSGARELEEARHGARTGERMRLL
ncbi:hypothetical protein BD310DRAFT_292215 [Dichomitus squalens]|uniref:Uncharacterized protein n=1 Tax=Dichomitus squalens TaxID=114155 RepID=A0A4V2K9R5_9APHY|nr:hypothetical protein BD310DRAFT_292215 [Dichomitus squalens]